MNWATMLSTQAASYNQLQDAIANGYFAWGGTTIPTSDQCMYPNLVTMSNYAQVTMNGARGATDLYIKSDFTANYTTTWTLYCVASSDWQGYASGAAACAVTSTITTATISFTGTAAVGTRIALVSPVNVLNIGGGTSSYYPNITTGGWTQFGLDANGYYIAAMGTCITTYSGTLYVNNNSVSSVNGFTALFSYSGGGVQTPIPSTTHFLGLSTLSGGYAGITGTNLVELQSSGGQTMNVTGVTDHATSAALSYTLTNNNTSDVQISITGLTSTNLTDGITIAFS